MNEIGFSKLYKIIPVGVWDETSYSSSSILHHPGVLLVPSRWSVQIFTLHTATQKAFAFQYETLDNIE